MNNEKKPTQGAKEEGASHIQNHALFRKQAEELVAKMTLEEAASQLSHASPAIERLGVPEYNWWNEALHGVARAGTATMFPQAIALAAMFDDTALAAVAEIIATEARAKYNAQSRLGDRDIYKGLTFWTPNINIFRDPRWGRGHETYGEDPYLTARLGVAFIRALQGEDKYMKAAACAKHFAVHSGPEAERHSFNATATMQDMWDTYLPAFEAAVREGGVEAVMGAYNRTNGEPCCAHTYLMQEVLRGKWDFKGHYVSDCWAIRDFHTQHHITATAPESAALALNKGCDLCCGIMYLHLLEAYNEGLVTEEDIRASAVRLFTTRYKLGLFADDCGFDDIQFEANDTPEHNNASFEASLRSVVMLKNNGILPLDLEKVNTLGVIGPNANNIGALIGNYFGTASQYITNVDGLRALCNERGVRLLYSEGCHLSNDSFSTIGVHKHDRLSEARAVAEHSDVVVLCLGLDATIEGEAGDTGNSFVGGDKTTLSLLPAQQKLLETVVSVGKPVVLVMNTGSAMDLTYADKNCAAILQAWYSGQFGGLALAHLIFGSESPAGKLPITFYRSDADLPPFDDYSMDGRTYRYFKGEPLYPFGFGLSYTTFEYSELKLNTDKLKAGEELQLSVTVTNTGEREAREIVQVYIRDHASKHRLPNFCLCAFGSVSLGAGESVVMEAVISPSSLMVVDENGKRFIEPGMFTVYAGGTGPDKRSTRLMGGIAPLSVEFEVVL